MLSNEQMIQVSNGDWDKYSFIDIDRIQNKQYDITVNDNIKELKGSVIQIRMYRDS